MHCKAVIFLLPFVNCRVVIFVASLIGSGQEQALILDFEYLNVGGLAARVQRVKVFQIIQASLSCYEMKFALVIYDEMYPF